MPFGKQSELILDENHMGLAIIVHKTPWNANCIDFLLKPYQEWPQSKTEIRNRRLFSAAGTKQLHAQVL